MGHILVKISLNYSFDGFIDNGLQAHGIAWPMILVYGICYDGAYLNAWVNPLWNVRVLD